MFRTGSGSLDRRRFLAGCGAIAAGGVAASVGAATPSPSRSVEVDLEAREALIDVAGRACPAAHLQRSLPGAAHPRARRRDPAGPPDQSPGRADQPALPRAARLADGQSRQRLPGGAAGRGLRLRAHRAGRLRRHLLVPSSSSRAAREAALAGACRAAPDRSDRAAGGALRGRGAGPGHQGPQHRGRPAGAPSRRRLGTRQERPDGARERRRSGRSSGRGLAGPPAADQRLQRAHAAAGPRRQRAAAGDRP